MAAPTVRGVTAPVIAASNTLPVATSPASTAIGDLVLVFLWSQGADQTTLTHTLQSGFTTVRTHAHDDGTTDGRLSVAYKVATVAGAQSYAPYAVANSTASQNAIGVMALTTGTFDLGASPFISASSSGTTNAAPDPPAVTGLTGDMLVVAVGAWHVTTAAATVTSAGANYAEQTEGPAGTHVTHLSIATRAMTGLSNATEDPPAFTDNVAPNGTARMTFAIPGALAEITGSGNVTLGAATAESIGTVAVSGSGNVTLGSAAATADGGVAVAGSGGGTLGGAAMSGAGTVATAGVTGELAATLGAATAASAGSVAIAGASSKTLGAATSSGAGAAAIAGGGGGALGGATVSAGGAVAVSGGGGGTLAGASASGAGAVAVQGAGGGTLGGATLSAAGGDGAAHGALEAVLGVAAVISAGAVSGEVVAMKIHGCGVHDHVGLALTIVRR